jgi:hypothetical protein
MNTTDKLAEDIERHIGYRLPPHSMRLLMEFIQQHLCERICTAIKAADDKSVEEAGYMLDSNDCIDIIRHHFNNN